MKLSIISPNISSTKNIKRVLDGFKDQNNQDFELILVLSNMTSAMYSVLNKYLEFFGSRLKFVVNNKRKSVQSDIVCAFHLIKGEYTMIYYNDNPFRSYFVKELIDLTQTYDECDIIEFRPRLIGTLAWKPNPRLKPGYVYNIENEPEFVAYAFPFIFNKLYKSSFLNKFVKYHPNESNDAKFCIDLTYYLLIHAQKYVYVHTRIVREFISSSLWLNPVNFINQFKNISNYVQALNIKLSLELEYASFYFMQIFLAGILSSWRVRPSSVLTGKFFNDRSNYSEKRAQKFSNELYKYIKKMHEENSLFFSTNPYILRSNPETQFMLYVPEIKKWNDILDKLQ